MDLITLTERGLYCADGDFYIDPWRPVARAVITHAHADHARTGHSHYLAAEASVGVLKARLGHSIAIEGTAYGKARTINGVRVSLHPAGHVLGSAQVRVESARGEVWVVSGDYKLDHDPTCAAFQPVRCHAFISESTFGLPIYRWQTHAQTFGAINAWWATNAAAGRASVLFGYAFGKAQRILASVDHHIGPIVCHGAVEKLNVAYHEAGVTLPLTHAADALEGTALSQALVVAPPSAQATPWLKRFGEYSDAFASGWMAIRGARKQRSVDRGFVLSDHADWPGLLAAVEGTGAQRVLVTHGSSAVMVRHLRDAGLTADVLATEFVGEGGSDGDASIAATP